MSDSTPTLEELNARLKENQQQIEQSTKSTTVSHHPPDWWSVQSAMTISAAVLLFGLLVLILAARYMMSPQIPKPIIPIERHSPFNGSQRRIELTLGVTICRL